MELCNKVDFSGQVIKVYPIKRTPYGTEILSFTILHSSKQIEAKLSREVKCRMFCIMVGSGKIEINQLQGKLVNVQGFLSQNAKSEIILHVQKIIFIDKGI